MENKKSLWQKTKIKNVELNNRIVRSATNEHLGTLEGYITDDYIKVYENLAKSGVGLIITSHMAIDKNQKADSTHISVNDSINDEKLKLLTDTVHKYGSKIVAQISYPGCRQNKIEGKPAKTPSGVDNTEALSYEEIKQYINNYIKTIKHLKEMGFDGVQLHMAHGYFLSEFLDPYYNRRTDSYGGTAKKRYQIIHEIVTEADKIKNRNFIILAKIDTVSKTEDNDFINQQIEVSKWLEEDGIDAIEISGINFKKYKQSTPYYLENALKIKENINIPIILVGGFRNTHQMEGALSKGIDFISMCRPFIADEDFLQKLKNGEQSRCISCNKCFEIYKTQYKRCVLRNDTIRQLEINFKN